MSEKTNANHLTATKGRTMGEKMKGYHDGEWFDFEFEYDMSIEKEAELPFYKKYEIPRSVMSLHVTVPCDPPPEFAGDPISARKIKLPTTERAYKALSARSDEQGSYTAAKESPTPYETGRAKDFCENTIATAANASPWIKITPETMPKVELKNKLFRKKTVYQVCNSEKVTEAVLGKSGWWCKRTKDSYYEPLVEFTPTHYRLKLPLPPLPGSETE